MNCHLIQHQIWDNFTRFNNCEQLPCLNFVWCQITHKDFMEFDSKGSGFTPTYCWPLRRPLELEIWVTQLKANYSPVCFSTMQCCIYAAHGITSYRDTFWKCSFWMYQKRGQSVSTCITWNVVFLSVLKPVTQSPRCHVVSIGAGNLRNQNRSHLYCCFLQKTTEQNHCNQLMSFWVSHT